MADQATALKEKLKERARDLGFDSCRVTAARLPEHVGPGLDAFLENGYHGTMAWMADTAERRKRP